MDSWFETLEFPYNTALLVRADKDKKYETQLKRQPSGNFVVQYRGRTDDEKKLYKASKALEKPKKRAQYRLSMYHWRNL